MSMVHQSDVVIIGGGLASLAAATQLSQKGVEVTLIRKAPGAAALSSGAWDLCDDPHRISGMEVDQWSSIHQNIHHTLQNSPHHPFQFYKPRFDGPAMFSWIQFQAKTLAKILALPMDGDGSNPIAAVTEWGTVKATAMLQKSMAATDLRRMKAARILVVGFQGLASFNGAFVAQALEAFQQQQANDYLEWVGQVDLTVPNLASKSSLSPFEIAHVLDQEENFVALSQELQTYLGNKVYTHLFFPPVMGMIHTSQIMEALEKVTGRRVGETLAFVPSVPGWRLSEAILKYFKSEGFDVLGAEAVGYESEGRRVQSVWVHQGDERIRVKAKSFILATGKYIGGGIQGKRQIRETLFGLPLFCDGKSIKGLSWSRLSRETMAQRQPFRSIGIQVNDHSQPLDAEGQVCFDNLFAAGQLLSGWDPGVERCGAGVSILSGAVAGNQAL